MFKLTRVSRRSVVLVAAILAAVASSAPAATAQSTAPSHGYTQLVIDPTTAKTLSSLNITVAPISPAWPSNGGIAFPITDGPLGVLTRLTITHAGGLALSDNGATVNLTDFNIVLAQRELTAIVNGGSRVPILNLTFAGAGLSLMSGTLTVGPVQGDLTQTAASALNAAFGLGTAIPAGLDLGLATVQLAL